MNAAPATPAPKVRNAYIDSLRGWSIFGVICVHFAGSFVTTDIHAWSPSFYLGLGLNQFFSFAVPLFVLLSGLLAGSSTRKVTLAEYYVGRFWRIVVPYLIASVPVFFLLNHYAQWRELPGLGDKLIWLVQHVGFYGVEPTLYFIPLIITLYLFQPVLKALPRWLNRLVPAISPAGFALLLFSLFLVLHVTLGVLCNRGTLNYYVWGRPNALFWVCYFFLGLHFGTLTALLTRRVIIGIALVAVLVALGALLWNANQFLDRSIVGAHFELNRLDFAYARPVMLIYDLAVTLFLVTGVALDWKTRENAISYLGRYTLEIYLWHILVLYYGAWRFPETLAACRAVPELIIIICATTAFVIAWFTNARHRLVAYLSQHRVAIIPMK
ncbi:MAG: acyltransferase [Cephaloticoccus sp.]|nr:acyltransferase [Cephaloticoccus sp.]